MTEKLVIQGAEAHILRGNKWIIKERKVRIIAAYAIIFDFPSFCFKYLYPYQKPDGGTNILIK